MRVYFLFNKEFRELCSCIISSLRRMTHFVSEDIKQMVNMK